MRQKHSTKFEVTVTVSVVSKKLKGGSVENSQIFWNFLVRNVFRTQLSKTEFIDKMVDSFQPLTHFMSLISFDTP